MDPFFTCPPSDATEEIRLQTLVRYGLLEHEQVRSFDRITKLAARRLGATRAMLAWVDRDHIWLRARHGFDSDHQPRSTALAAPLLASEVLWTEDATTGTHPILDALASQLDARFLAVAPLSTYNGQRLGALVVADPEPRPFEARQLQELEELAETLMKQLETRRLYHRLGRNEGVLTARRPHQSRCARPANRPASHEVQPRLADRSTLLRRLGRRLEALRHRPRPQNLPAALVLFDLRRFRALNARLGYAAGDQALEEIGRRLDKLKQRGETVARLNGATFAWFLADLAETEEAEGKLTELHTALTTPVCLGDDSLELDPAMTLVWLEPTLHRFADDVLAEAEAELYEAKTTEAKTTEAKTAASTTPSEPSNRPQRSERSLANDELSLRYRPIHDRVGRFEGLEAHLRWHGPLRSAPL